VQRLLIVTVTAAVAVVIAVVSSAAGASKPVACHATPNNQNKGIIFVTQATGMTCSAAVKDIGTRTAVPGKTFKSPGGFACLQKSKTSAKTTWSCRKGTKGYRFELVRASSG
jgi:hypothetical protein